MTSEIRRLAWAKSLIRAKFRSAAIEFRRMVDNGWHFGDRKFKNAMRRAAAEAEAAASLPELSGIEGLAAREYFGIFGAALPGDFVWLGRHYRPASDPVNALLSFTYGVTAGRLEEGCRRHGLDHRLAFLHRNGYGSGGLSADLIEPLRSAWCDHLVLWTLHRGAIDAEDFRFDGAACRLSEDGRRKYLALLQRLLLPRLEKAAKPLFGMVCKSLAEPDRIPDFSSLLPER